MVTTLPYGSWPSPISAELLATGGTRLGGPQLVGDEVWWTEGIATEEGRNAIVRTDGPVHRPEDAPGRSEEHTSELQSRGHLVCRLLLEKKKHKTHERSIDERRGRERGRRQSDSAMD